MAAPGAFMGARPPMDRAHEGDPTRPPAESFGLTPGVCLCSMVLRPVERLVFSPKER